MRFEGVLFDIGGVVVDTRCGPAGLDWLKRLNLSEDEANHFIWNQPAAITAMAGKLAGIDFWKIVGKQLGLNDEESLSFRDAFMGNHSIDGSVLNLIHTLRQRRIKIGVISNTLDDTEKILNYTGLDRLFNNFDTVVLSHQVGFIKPDPEIYLLACRRLAVHPKHTVHIDDLRRNVEGARAAGLVGWHYRRGEFDKLAKFLLDENET